MFASDEQWHFSPKIFFVLASKQKHLQTLGVKNLLASSLFVFALSLLSF